MTTRSVTTKNAALLADDNFDFDIEVRAGSSTSKKSGCGIKSQKIIAGFLEPSCEHDWFELAEDLQTLANEGKTIWKCRDCNEITNTYSWRTP